MVSRHRVLTSRHLALLALLLLPALAALCDPGQVFLFAGYYDAPVPPTSVKAKDVPTACPGTSATDLDFAMHRSAAAPDGSVYYADYVDNVVLKLSDECGPNTALRVAGNGTQGVAGNLPAPATEVPLDGPYGIDVAADGTVYIAEYQYSVGPDPSTCEPNCTPQNPPWYTAGRILKLDLDGVLSEVAAVSAPSQVEVGREGWLYVSARNFRGHAGIHRIELATGSSEEIIPDVDAEGLAIYENVATGERLLYVPVAKWVPGSNAFDDAYLCSLDLTDPQATCEVLLRPVPYLAQQPVVGPAIDPVYTDFPTTSQAVINDVDVDTSGTRHFTYVAEDIGHFYSMGWASPIFTWGGLNPSVYSWHVGEVWAARHFGYSTTYEDWYVTTMNRREALATTTTYVWGDQVITRWGTSLSVANSDEVLLNTMDCGWNGGNWDNMNSRSYRVAGNVPGERLFLGADVATFALESLSEPPTTDPYLAENVVITGVASFVTDPVTEELQSVSISGTYPGVEGGTAYVGVIMNRSGGSLVGSLMVVDSSVGFTHYHGAANVIVSSEAVSGNDVELEMESEDVGGGKGLFAVDIKLRDGY
jgi:hypothetical protein